LTPGESGFSPISTELGTVTVSLKDITAYANGAKVLLEFGNTTNATMFGLKAKIEWGKVDENRMPIRKSTRSREVNLIESIRPGAWASTKVILDGVPPTDLGLVQVRDLSFSSISLLR
jgi:hypothetical protein